MDNILENLADVNSFYSQLWLNKLGAKIGQKAVFRKLDGENFSFISPADPKPFIDCPLCMDKYFVHHPYIKCNERKDPEQKYPEIAKQAHSGSIKDNTLKETVARWADSVPMICTNKENGYKIFEAYAKSTKRYNIKNQWRIVDHAKTCEEAGLKPYFLTITCDPKNYWHNYIVAWKYFKKQCNRILKNTSRKFNAEYQIVYEAQKTGNPHAHAVLWLPSWVSDDVVIKFKKKEYISKGSLKDYLRKYEQFTGFMELRRGDKQNAVYYLCKYITKSATSDIKKIAKDTNRLSIEDRKMLLTVFMPVLTKVRQFQVSQLKNIKKTEILKQDVADATQSATASQCSAPKQAQTFEEVKESCIGLTVEQARAKLAPYLNMLSINLPKCARSSAHLISYGSLSKGFNVSTDKLNDLSEEKRKKIYKSSKAIGCEGCILSDIIENESGLENFGYKNTLSFEEGEIEQISMYKEDMSILAYQALFGNNSIIPDEDVEKTNDPIHENHFFRYVKEPFKLLMSNLNYSQYCLYFPEIPRGNKMQVTKKTHPQKIILS